VGILQTLRTHASFNMRSRNMRSDDLIICHCIGRARFMTASVWGKRRLACRA